MKKKMTMIGMVLFLVLLFSVPAQAKTTIKLNKKSTTIYINKSVQLKATVKGTKAKVRWSTGNKKIATVNARGKVTGKKAGTVTITAKANGKTAKCKISVKKKRASTGTKVLAKKEQHKLYDLTIKEYDRKMRQYGVRYGESGRATYYAYADIDKNGIDELILRYDSLQQSSHNTNVDTGYGESTYIYTIKNGKVKTVLSSGEFDPRRHSNFVQIYQGSNLINRGFSHMPVDHVFYRYKDGILSSKATLQLVGGGMWRVNNRRVSVQEWKKKYNKATNGGVGYPMSRYTG